MAIGRKISILLALILLSSFAYAACTDTDGGPIDPAKPTKFIGIKGATDYGTGPKQDYCVSRDGGVIMPDSHWIREFYCDGDDMVKKDYLCSAYDYLYCEDGVCTNYTGTQQALDDVGTPPSKEDYSNCGNEKLDGKEECDPPGKICMAYGGGVGTCSDKCECVSKAKQEENKTEIPEDTNQEETNETEEEDTGTQKAEVKFTVESEEEPESNKTMSSPTGALPTDIQEIIKETKAESEDLTNRPGIKITSAITGLMKKVWYFFAGLLGG